MQIEISDDAAKYLQTKALEAGFAAVDAYLLNLANEQKADGPDDSSLAYDQWRAKFQAFISRQPSRNPEFDDSRESIYAGR